MNQTSPFNCIQNRPTKTYQAAKCFVAELAHPHAQSAWGLGGK